MTTTFPLTPVRTDRGCEYCQRYQRPCGRHDDRVNLILYPSPNRLGLAPGTAGRRPDAVVYGHR